MSFNQPPPNPYGQPPQQPGPPPGYGYPQQSGAPQQPPQPGPYGYPQQGQNPYGQPQQGQNPYSQNAQQPNPYGQQPGWGGVPPVPPLPPKKNTGKIVTIVAAAVVLIGGGIAIAATSGGGGGGGGGSVVDSVKYKLTTPQTVATEYQKSDSDSDAEASDSDLSSIPGLSDPHTVSAGYATSDATKQLIFSGVYGTIGDPEAAVDSMFATVQKGSSTSTAIGSPQSVSPAGLDGAVMKCQLYQDTDGGTDAKFPICIWGDSSTLGVVADADTASLLTGHSPSLSDAGTLTAEVRTDTRVKLS